MARYVTTHRRQSALQPRQAAYLMRFMDYAPRRGECVAAVEWDGDAWCVTLPDLTTVWTGKRVVVERHNDRDTAIRAMETIHSKRLTGKFNSTTFPSLT